jgi:hypothetical protein
MPPAPPGAPGNPIELLSSDSAVSSPEQAAASQVAKDRRITELALASKDTWCRELSFSLDIEKAFVAQVFDQHQPRTYDTLVSFTIGELAEELGMEAQTLASELRASGVELGCKPAAGPAQNNNDDDADTGGVDRHAQQQRASQGGAAASASGQQAPLQERATSGTTQRAREQSDLAARGATGEGVQADDGRCDLLVAKQEQAWLSMAVGGTHTCDGGQGTGTYNAAGNLASVSKQGGNSLSEGRTGTTTGAPAAHLKSGAADKRERDGTAGDGRLTLTDAAIHTLLELHNGEREILVPLEGLSGGSQHLQSLVERLQAAAHAKHNHFLPRGVAVAPLEVARHQQDADGWPTVENTLRCLQRRERATPRKDADGTRKDMREQATPTQASSTPGPEAQKQPLRQDKATMPPAMSEKQKAVEQQRKVALEELEKKQLLSTILSASAPGHKLVDLDPGDHDDSNIRQLVSDMKQLEEEVFVNLAKVGFDPSLGKKLKLNATAPRLQEILKEMQEQRSRLRERVGKPYSLEALRAGEEVLDRFPDNFRPPGREPCKLGVYKITLKDKSKSHIAMPRRVNPIVLADMRRQVQELVDNGVIERCTSRPNSVYAVVMAKKPGKPGQYILCQDMRELNYNTVPAPYLTPNVAESLDKISGRKLYCSFDFSSWFHQFELAEKDRDKVAFIIPGDETTAPQIYRFKRVCFSLLNATWFTQRQLQEALEQAEGCEGIYPFVDDVVIAADTIDEMVRKLEAFMKFCRDKNIKLKREKCVIATSAVKHLGFVVGEDGKHLDPARVESLMSISAPNNLKGLKSLLGSFSFVWVAGMADIAAPLTGLMGETAKRLGFKWGPEEEDALAALKIAVAIAPQTMEPDYTLPFHISVDASDEGVGAVLWQWRRAADVSMAPFAIANASRRFSLRESK